MPKRKEVSQLTVAIPWKIRFQRKFTIVLTINVITKNITKLKNIFLIFIAPPFHSGQPGSFWSPLLKADQNQAPSIVLPFVWSEKEYQGTKLESTQINIDFSLPCEEIHC